MFRPRRERLKGLSFNRMIPNILTMLALCAGLTSIRYGLQEDWRQAVAALTVAAILDFLDGRIARILKGTSKFGAELDSLSDFIGFGVAPALLLYMWTMKDAGPIGWVLVLLFSVCSALRLARFNTGLDEPALPPWAKNYFTGVPSPGGAGMVLLPMILWFQTDSGFFRHPLVVGPVIIGVSCLLISRIPIYSFKNLRVPHRYVLATMIFVGLLAASSVSAPWLTLSAIVIAYFGAIPFSVKTFKAQKSKAAEYAREHEASSQPAD